MPFNLTGQQNEMLTNILCIAYPTIEALSVMLNFKLEKNIEEFNGGNVRAKIIDIIERAKAENWIAVLLDGCIQGNPENVELQRVVKSINDEIIRIELSERYSDPHYSLFRPIIETLQELLSTQKVPPLIFFAFLSMIQKIYDEEALGHSAITVINGIINGQAMPNNWKFGELYRKNKVFFDRILNNFKESIEINTEPTPFQVPFVLAIMNKSEAKELSEGNLLDSYSQQIKNDFDDIQAFLDGSGFNNWVEHYGENSEDWLPFSNAQDSETVKQIIEKILQSITQSGITYTPVFINVQTLNSEENRATLKKLRSEGCIIVLDSISMCHPTINSHFQQAALDKFLNTSVVNIAFNSNVLDELNKISLAIQIKLPDMEFSKRKYEVEDFESCRDLNEERLFKAWITVRATKMSKSAHPIFMFKNLET